MAPVAAVAVSGKFAGATARKGGIMRGAWIKPSFRPIAVAILPMNQMPNTTNATETIPNMEIAVIARSMDNSNVRMR
jgi:hypothetical protein